MEHVPAPWLHDVAERWPKCRWLCRAPFGRSDARDQWTGILGVLNGKCQEFTWQSCFGKRTGPFFHSKFKRRKRLFIVWAADHMVGHHIKHGTDSTWNKWQIGDKWYHVPPPWARVSGLVETMTVLGLDSLICSQPRCYESLPDRWGNQNLALAQRIVKIWSKDPSCMI